MWGEYGWREGGHRETLTRGSPLIRRWSQGANKAGCVGGGGGGGGGRKAEKKKGGS